MAKKSTPTLKGKQTTLDVIYDEVTRNLPPENDEYYIQHAPRSLTVALKKESSTKKINIIGDNDEKEETHITAQHKNIKKNPQHPRDRLKSKSKIYDAIQNIFPADHIKFYFEHDPDLLMVRIKKDPDQKEKDELSMLILNIGKRIARTKSKSKTELN